MSRPQRRWVAAAACVGALSALAACSGGSPSANPKPSQSAPPSASIAPLTAGGSAAAGAICTPQHFRLEPQHLAAQQAHRLVARMSLAQEITLMHGVGLGGANGAVGATAAIPALHIPALRQSDGPGGVGDFTTGVTQLPAPIALAATFDPAAARCYGQVIGQEARLQGLNLIYGPTINLVRVPQWGRAFESFGEDPLLSGTIGGSYVTGMQSAGVMAEVKHFAVYNQEVNRNTPADNAIVSQRVLQEIYLKAWQYVARAHPAAVMCSYSTINSVGACQNHALIHDFLDRLPGFAGFVGADFSATHSTVPSALAGLDQEQPYQLYFGKPLLAAVRAGRVPRAVIDEAAFRVVAQLYRFRMITDPPPVNRDAVVTNAASATVSDAAANEGTVLLKNARKVLPLSANGSVAVIGPAAAADTVSSGGGTASVVSPGTVTPLAGIQSRAPTAVKVTYAAGLPRTSNLASIPAADLSPAFPAGGTTGRFHATLTAPATGNYVFALKGSRYFSPTDVAIDGRALFSDPDSPPMRPYSASVQLTAGHTYRVIVSGGAGGLTWATPAVLKTSIDAAAAAAKDAGTAVVVVSDPQESEATDRSDLTLPSAQDQLVSAVAAANPRTVVVIEAGAAVTMPWLSKVAGVIDTWYPGQTDGSSLAKVLFGVVNPSGHLPMTFPQTSSTVPVATAKQYPGVGGKVAYSEGLNVGYRWWIDTDHHPLFPFGFGLSYTTFRYGTPTASVREVGGRPIATVTAKVTNTGDRAGADVAQVYLDTPVAGEPDRSLAAYQRVSLKPGQSTTVRVSLSGLQLATYATGHWSIAAGSYRVYVGDSSATPQLESPATFRVERSSQVRD